MRVLSRRSSALAVAALLAACATNPATGRSEFMLVSQDQEIAMGREYDPQIVASIGLYPDTALQRYVQELGTSLAKQSERPGLPWTFRVLDDPQVNAFAIPGGYIYITRGILAHLNSEAQLASVLGHEIGHVTARHSASQMSQQQLAQLGLAVGAAVSERFAQYADLASQGLGLLFLKYSRDDESQADALGLRYIRRTKHDVREMPKVFAMLAAVSAAAGPSDVPAWMQTHPQPEDRFAAIEAAITRTPQDTAGIITRRDEYERRLNGLVFGEDPRNGYFRGTRFIQPTMRFSLTFPEGWRTKNEANGVQGAATTNDAAVQLTISEQRTAAAAAQAFAGQQGLTAAAPTSANINGLATASTSFAAVAEGDTLRGAVTFVEHGGMVFQLIGYAPSAAWAARQTAIAATLRSFAPVTDRALLDVKPQVLGVFVLDRQASIEQLKASRPSPLTAAQLGILNQIPVEEQILRGRLVKWVTGPAAP